MIFNYKLVLLVPAILVARKLDGSDPTLVYWIRLEYGVIQCICILIALYTYIQASAIATSEKDIVYVPPNPKPFQHTTNKKKYIEISYGAHVLSTARYLLGSMIFGIVMTVALHLYKGMIVGLAVQTMMGPLNLLENVLVKALLFGNGIRKEDKIFNEKVYSKLQPSDDIVDQSGNTIHPTPKTLDDAMLDAWEAGADANLATLMGFVDAGNCNYQCEGTGWTPLMVVAGLNAKGTTSAMRQLKEYGVNMSLTDADGWNALHWAAFHGNLEGARPFIDNASLREARDNEGKRPIDLAKAEGNDEIVTLMKNHMERIKASTSSNGSSDTGLRKRK